MYFISVISQITSENSALYAYGPMGVVLAWFMFRAERTWSQLVKEIRSIGHKFEGVQMAMLIVEINRDGCNPTVHRLASEMLANLESEKKAREKRDSDK